MSDKAHHIWSSEAIQREQALEYVEVLLKLSQLPPCPDCGKDYSHPRMDGFTLYRVPCGCEINESGVVPKEMK